MSQPTNPPSPGVLETLQHLVESCPRTWKAISRRGPTPLECMVIPADELTAALADLEAVIPSVPQEENDEKDHTRVDGRS